MARVLGLTVMMLVAAALAPAAAVTFQGVNIPDTVTVQGRTLYLNGYGLRTLTILQIRAYVAALYVERPSHDARTIAAEPGPKVILLYYLHDGSKERVEHAFDEGLQRSCADGGCSPADQVDFRRLVDAFPPVKAGDTSSYVLTGPEVQVTVNNRSLITLSNPNLSARLLDSFIGPHPPSEALRDGLLGAKQG